MREPRVEKLSFFGCYFVFLSVLNIRMNVATEALDNGNTFDR